MRDLHRGNELCLISPNGLTTVIRYEIWRIYESKLMTWRLNWRPDIVEEIGRIPLTTLITLQEDHLEVAVNDGQETDLMKPWGVITNRPHREWSGHHNAALDTMSHALRRAACSPFSNEIKHTKMRRWFTKPPFTIYDGKTNPVEHISHYVQMMSLYSQNDGLMCKCSHPVLGRQLLGGLTV